ncbi:shikimate dehydrogenase family protein, partial [Sulfolobus acidocaldarius]
MCIRDRARVIGAVNTIHNLNGYNTDYIAIYNLIKEKLIDKPSICTVFGAGGAGRASIYALLKLGCEVYVINRSLERAQSLEKDFKEFGYDIKIISSCKPGDIIVNATPNSSYVPDECIKGKLVVDLVYNPVKTPLILKAEKTGIRSINGLEILVRQAMEAERIWFGKSLSDEEVVKFLYARKLVR